MSSAATLPHPTYLKQAFTVQYNLILLGGAALFSLASASPWPLLAGLALELVWLAAGPLLPAFRRRVEARLAVRAPVSDDEQLLFAMQTLDRGHTSRLLEVSRVVEQIGTAARAAGQAEVLLQLGEVRPGCLRLCQVHQRLTKLLADTPQALLEQELVRLSKAFAAESDLAVRLTLRQAVNLAQRRLDQRGRIAGTRRAIELKLDTIQNTLSHIRAQQLAAMPPRQLQAEVDGLVAQLGAVAALEAEFGELSQAPASLSERPARAVTGHG